MVMTYYTCYSSLSSRVQRTLQLSIILQVPLEIASNVQQKGNTQKDNTDSNKQDVRQDKGTSC